LLNELFMPKKQDHSEEQKKEEEEEEKTVTKLKLCCKSYLGNNIN